MKTQKMFFARVEQISNHGKVYFKLRDVVSQCNRGNAYYAKLLPSMIEPYIFTDGTVYIDYCDVRCVIQNAETTEASEWYDVLFGELDAEIQTLSN